MKCRDLAKDVTLDQKVQGLHEMKVFRQWFQDHIIKNDAILIMPSGRPGPKYRDAPNGLVSNLSELLDFY